MCDVPDNKRRNYDDCRGEKKRRRHDNGHNDLSDYRHKRMSALDERYNTDYSDYRGRNLLNDTESGHSLSPRISVHETFQF